MTDQTNTADENGEHPADDIVAANYHFNVLHVVRQSLQRFVERNPGKTPRYFYAPEPLLWLVDEACKTAASGQLPPGTTLGNAVVTHVFGMELVAVPGTCCTVTEEKLHKDAPVASPEAPSGQYLN